MNQKILVREDIELKTLTLQDAPKLFEAIQSNKAYLSRWLGWLNDDKSVADTEKYIVDSIKRFENKEGIDFSIWQNDTLIGGIGLYPWDTANKKTSIGYWLIEASQGKGIMTDSLKAVINYAFQEMKVNRIKVTVAVENTKSSALPKKLGFTFEGVEREAGWLYDHFVDLEVYSLLAKEWQKRQN